MMWFYIAAAVVVVLVSGLVLVRRRSCGRGAARARDVGPVNTAQTDVYVAHTLHQGNIHGQGGGPF